MSDLAPPVPLSLRELVNTLNQPRPEKYSHDGILIEQDWVEALRLSHEAESSPQVQSMAILMDEIARYKKLLAQSEAKRAELAQMIDTDPMCPVLNRRAFERELGREITLAQRSGRQGSVLFFDLNGLKAINDTYGHAVGDRAIERVAKMLILSCRTTDIIGRLGGDEFAVIMPDTPPSGAVTRAERVSDLLARVPLIVGRVTLMLSSAYGAAPFGLDDGPREVLVREALSAADAAMYAHKQEMKAQMR